MSSASVYDAEPIPDAARAEIDRMLRSGDLFRYTSDDAPVSRLEGEFAAAMGTRFALAVSSCSAALFLSLRALDLPAGARVLIPAFTFAAVPSAVIHAGCEPVLAEVDESFRLVMADFESRLDDTIAAVVISHMRGHTSDMDRILELCAARDIPVIEDAAHSLGTLWHGRKIGTLGKVGCFSFQSYKMINAGEGGILVTDDADLAARAIVMSGAYEHNWRKHPGMADAVNLWQNRLPLYNMRMQNLSAAVIRPQLAALETRVNRGRANHDYVAARLNATQWFHVPPALGPEERAPDSIQFNLRGFDSDEAAGAFARAAAERGVAVQVFGLSRDNARAFWNWQFLTSMPELPRTRAMLMRACDVRLPVRLERPALDQIVKALTDAAETVQGAAGDEGRHYGT